MTGGLRWSSAVLAAAILSVPLHAQRPDTAVADTAGDDRPFVRGGVYDKPYLTRLQGRTAIGGYAEAHARYERIDGLRDAGGFEVKRVNLFASARVSGVVRFGAEIELEDGADEILLEYAAIDVRLLPALTLRGGMILSPLGRFNLSHDSPLNEFTDRPLVATELLGVALSEPGFGALGTLAPRGAGRLTYEAYLTNGFHDGLITAAEAGTRIPLGRGNHQDNNASPAVVGRLAWSPRVGWELGLSGHHGAWNVFETEGVRIDRTRHLTIGVIDAEITVLGTRLAAEAADARIDVPEGLRGIYAGHQRGIYAEAIREVGRLRIRAMPRATLAAKARVDYVDFDTDKDGTSIGRITAGLNFRPTSDTVLKLDFARGRERDEFNNPSEHAAILISLATYF